MPIQCAAQALEQECVPFSHEFAVEKDRSALKILSQTFNIKRIHKDVRKVSIKHDLNYVDFFWWSPECQNFSRAGTKTGCKGKDGDLAMYGTRYITTHEPELFVMEQTDNIVASAHVKFLAAIKRQVAEKFELWEDVLNSRDYGLPQARRRYYLVGRKRGGKRKFCVTVPLPKVLPPCTLPMIALDDILNDDDGDVELPEDSVGLPNLIHCFKKMIKKGINPLECHAICDVMGSNSTVSYGHFPTITRTRAGQTKAYFITHKLRWAKKEELMKAQGIIPQKLKFAGVLPNAVGRCVGNGVPVAVARALFRSVLIMD